LPHNQPPADPRSDRLDLGRLVDRWPLPPPLLVSRSVTAAVVRMKSGGSSSWPWLSAAASLRWTKQRIDSGSARLEIKAEQVMQSEGLGIEKADQWDQADQVDRISQPKS